VARHKYIPGHFVCVEFAAGVWYELMQKGINSKVRIGSKGITSIHRANHAWVMAEISLGNWLAIEPQRGVVYPESGSFYYRGFDFSEDGPVREYSKAVDAHREALIKYNDAVKVLNDYTARYNNGNWVDKGALSPAVNQQQQSVNMRQAEMENAANRITALQERATPSG